MPAVEPTKKDTSSTRNQNHVPARKARKDLGNPRLKHGSITVALLMHMCQYQSDSKNIGHVTD